LKPEISIGFPVFNGEKYIEEAIISLLKQSFTNFELIISDNASTDSTEKICLKHQESDRYIKQPVNNGALFNFKFVLAESIAPYFMWMAYDDICSENNYLEELIKPLQSGLDYSFPKVRIITMDGDTPKISHDNIMTLFDGCKSRYAFSSKSIQINSFQVYGLFKKEMLFKHHKYFEKCADLKYFSEGLFVHSIASNLNGAYISGVTKIYRRHSNSTSNQVSKSMMLNNFIIFTKRSISFWIYESELTLLQRFYILTIVFRIHGKYTTHLFIKVLKEKGKRLFLTK
jgi:glycosyltransferase involved in cell wall biosynthesis